ncbi:MAG: hypothetical protein WC735_02790 [Candidatus Paceibacterota bacterium]
MEGIKAHPYWTIITFSVIEGRLTAIAVGAFVAQGYVNPIVAYSIFVTMGVLGDMFYYFVGRVGNRVCSFFIRKSWRDRIGQFKGEWNKNLPRAIVASKVLVGSKPVIIVAGMTKMSLPKFMRIIVVWTLVIYLVCMLLGYFFGHLIL